MIFLGLTAIIFALDYVVKTFVEQNYPEGSVREFFGGKLILRNFHNPHGAFGLFKEREEIGEALSAGALLGVSWDFVRILFSKKRRLEKLGLGMALGGGLNNLFDRKKRGYVVDYFSLGVKNEEVRNVAFNLSDLFIVFGALFYLIGQFVLLFGKEQKNRKHSAS